MIEKIDIDKIRGTWQEWGNDTGNGMRPVAGGDDTIESIKIVAEKINEIIEDVNYMNPARGKLYKTEDLPKEDSIN